MALHSLIPTINPYRAQRALSHSWSSESPETTSRGTQACAGDDCAAFASQVSLPCPQDLVKELRSTVPAASSRTLAFSGRPLGPQQLAEKTVWTISSRIWQQDCQGSTCICCSWEPGAASASQWAAEADKDLYSTSVMLTRYEDEEIVEAPSAQASYDDSDASKHYGVISCRCPW